jgi:diadenosine tetraphosphate (Ap4A) HIT family hydrolase
MLKIQECCLCSQIDGRPDNDLIALFLPEEPYVRRIMLESDAFAVIPSLGPLVAGHSLLCPKSHVRSFASLDRRLHREYQEIKETLKAALRDRYRRTVHLFEHGMAAAGTRVVCTVDHAHMHFLPLPEAFDAAVDGAWTTFDGSLTALSTLSGGDEYVFYETPAGLSRLLSSRDRSVESQYMRKIIADALGHGDQWNWRTAPNARSADDTWRGFARVGGRA